MPLPVYKAHSHVARLRRRVLFASSWLILHGASAAVLNLDGKTTSGETTEGDGTSQGPIDLSNASSSSPNLVGMLALNTIPNDDLLSSLELGEKNALLAEAREFYKAGDLTNALSEVKQALELHPNNVAFLTLRSSMEFDLKRYDDALVSARAATNAAPDRILPLAMLAPVLEAQGFQDKAESTYERMLQLDPAHTYAHSALGMIKCGRGDYEQGIAHFERVVEKYPTNVSTIFNLGIAQRESEAYEEAISCFKKASFLQPSFVAAKNELGIAYQLNNQSAEAETAFREAISRNPRFEPAHTNLANILAATGRKEEALQVCLDALNMNQDRHQVWQTLFDLLSRIAVKDNSLPPIEGDPAKEDPRITANKHYQRALLHLQRNQPAGAQQHLLEALKLTPSNPEYYNDYGAMLAADGHTQLARPFFKYAIHLHPKFESARDNLEELEARLAFAPTSAPLAALQVDPAVLNSENPRITRAREQVARYPKDPRKYFDAAIAIAEEIHVVPALPFFERATALAPDRLTYQLALSKAYSQSGRNQEALMTYKPVFEKNRREPEYQNRMIWLIMQQKDLTEKQIRIAHNLALRLNEQTSRENITYLQTLISTQVALKDFDSAMETARTALKVANRSGDVAVIEQVNAQIEQIIGLQ